MRSIRRLTAGAICVFVTLCAPPALTETRWISVAPFSSVMAIGGAAANGVFYFAKERLYACKADDTEATAQWDGSLESAPTLVAAGNELLAVDNRTGMLSRWSGAGFVDELQLDWDGINGPDERRLMFWPVWTGDALYALFTPPANSAGMDGFSLTRFDAVTGERDDLPSRYLFQLAPYKDGMLLGLSLNLLQYTGEGGGTVVTVDAATGETVSELYTLAGLTDGGVAYDAESDTVYVLSGGQLMASAGGGPFVGGAYLNPPAPINAAFAAVMDGWYAMLAGSDLLLCELSAEADGSQPLRIKGFGVDESLLQAFELEHPGAQVARIESLMTSAASIMADIASADAGADIYTLYTFQSLDSLMAKGYLADLSEIPGVAGAVSEMYPVVRDAVTRDGKAFAFPIKMTALTGAWSVDHALLERFGLETPETMLDYIRLLDRWEGEYAEDHPEYTVTSSPFPREQYLVMALQNYSLTYETPDAPLTLDTPVFRAVLEAIGKLPYEPVDLEAVMRGETSMPLASGAHQMIEITVGDALNRFGERDEDGRPVRRVVPPPPFEKGVPSSVMALVTVCVINPNSRNRELAERFIAYAAQNMPAENRILFCPDYNEPLRPEGYESGIASLRDEIEALEEALPGMEEADRRTAGDLLALRKQELERREAVEFAVTAQAIEDYRVAAERLNLLTRSAVVNLDNPEASKEINGILLRYMAGNGTLDEALRELDRLMQMVYLERIQD